MGRDGGYWSPAAIHQLLLSSDRLFLLFLHGVDPLQRVERSIRNMPDVVVVEGEDC